MFKKLALASFFIVSVFFLWRIIDYFGLLKRTPASLSLSSSTSSASVEPLSIELEYQVVAENLTVPWSIVFTAPNRVLVAERPGRIRAILDGKLQAEPLIVFPEIDSRGEEGLMGMTLDPDYASNNYLYVCYASPNGSEYQVSIARLVDAGSAINKDTTILSGIPASQYHAGCAIRFGPDKKLYVSTGDAQQKEAAQNVAALVGKMLRLNTDGSVPSDNPIANSLVWSYGHRNPQGFDWYPGSDVLYASEHGPTIFDGPAGGDEVNIITRAGNYGWPVTHHQLTAPDILAPVLEFTPAIAPASGTFYSSDTIPQLKNMFLVGMLKGEGILVVKPNRENISQIGGYEMIQLPYGRIRAIAQSPEGELYFSTSNQDGRGTPQEGDDKIIKIRAKK